MTAYRNVNGTFRQCPAIWRNVNGTWRTVTAAWRNVNGTWRQFFANAASLTISPASSYGHTTNAGTVTGNSVTAQTSGGSGSFTYAWSKATGSDSRISITNPNGATTAFTANLPANSEADATAVCTVTDTVTGIVNSASCGVTLTTGVPN